MNVLFGGEEGNRFEDTRIMREEVNAVKICDGLHREAWGLAVESRVSP